MRRVTVRFANLDVEFTDRDRAIKQVIDWGERGTWHPIVIYGPEGCGKSALLKQATAILRDLGYEVFYLNPLGYVFDADVSFPDIKRAFLGFVREALAENALGRSAWAVFDFVNRVLSVRRGRIAVIADDVFQVIGVDKAAAYVKGLLNMIEYPQYNYENMVVLVATSEGLSREEIGRHRWADIMPMWNMPREGFEQLYGRIPGDKPPFGEVWKLTGGNPDKLAELYRNGWRVGDAVRKLMNDKYLTADIVRKWRDWLEEAVEDPDKLWGRGAPEDLLRWLVGKNLIIYNMHYREQQFWIDEPPPERDQELGVGRYIAWQTPLHREAVRQALREASA